MKNTKRSLTLSLVSLMLCFAMLFGTTYAWFTDSVSSTGNKIISGKLKLDLEVLDKTTDQWHSIKDSKEPLFNNRNWEPGYTEVTILKIENEGNLALKWVAKFVSETELSILADVIDVYVLPSDTELEYPTGRELVGYTKVGTVKDFVNTMAQTTKGVLYPEGSADGVSVSYLGIALKMQETAGNVYQKMSLGGSFDIQILATQQSYENDSFGNDYDSGATFPEIKNADLVLTVPMQNGLATEDTNKTENGLDVTVRENTKLTSSKVSVTKQEVVNGEANIQLGENDEMRALDLHADGVAPDNTVPLVINLGETMPRGLNIGNYSLYHVENGVTVRMTSVSSVDELDEHNEFYYDPAIGELTVAMATFSEIALVADTENAWNGTIANSFAGGDGTSENPYLIANADQLALLGDKISNDNASYSYKHYKLIANINLGGEENTSKGIIFYPIGYTKVGGEIATQSEEDMPEYFFFDDNGEDYANTHVNDVIGADNKTSVWYTYGGSFKGVFDGNGNTIKNIYQNTWQMRGNYDGHYYKEAMGIFGYVNGGTVKNLSVDNFTSDGEFTPTGVVAAYARNATFENIAITNCNPRVYNTGNGGIVGIGGSSTDEGDVKLTFTNITVDKTNKISALWGSWDVACGGIMGMFPGNGLVHFENCHIGAQIDVYNDVCGNYQYYWYRYAGMVIGSIRKHTTDANGYTIPDTNGITASNSTVHFGDWNDYYYCELVANSLASYTHDHQFSRLTKIASLDEIKSGDAWKKTGNFLLGDECYHIIEKDGVLVRHFHEDSGYETVNGESILKEDKQRVYLPFNQIFQGYGWGVKNVGFRNDKDLDFDGITILDREEANSINKFAVIVNGASYEMNTTVTLGDIFAAVYGVSINTNTLMVFVSPVGENSTADAVYTPNTADWTKGTLRFSGIGALKIVISDYTYCREAVASITVTEPESVDKFTAKENLTYTHILEGDTIEKTLGDIFSEKSGVAINYESITVDYSVTGSANVVITKNANDWTQSTLVFTGVGTVTFSITDEYYCNATTATVTVANPEEKQFDLKFPNVDKYIYRVGNQNSIELSSLFGAELTAGATVTVGFENISGNAAGTYTENASAWEKGSIKFTDTGVVEITIDSNAFTEAKALVVEVVNATNLTSAQGTTKGEDFVLLQNINTSTYTNYWDCTVYGNGFTYSLKGAPTTYNSKNGHGILITQNAVLDNLVIVGDVYQGYGAYKDNEYYNAAIDVMGNTTIQNCYISGCAAPVKVRSDVLIKDTTLYGGAVANMIIMSGTATLENVTTANYDDGRDIIGMGIVIHSDATETAKLVINGTFTQYNFISESKVPNDTYAQSLYDCMFDSSCSQYHFGSSPNRYLNTGIISLTESFSENAISGSGKDALGYKGMSVSKSGIEGYVYTQPNTVGAVNNNYDSATDPNKSKVQGDYLPTTNFDLGSQAVNGEDTYVKGNIKGVEVRYIKGETPLTLDITKLMTVFKYEGVNYSVKAVCKDPNGNVVATNGVVTFNTAGNYTLEFTVEDNMFYNVDGSKSDKSVERTYTVSVSVAIAEPAIKDAVITVNKTALDGSYTVEGFTTDQTIKFNPLSAITITDAEGTVNLTTNIASTSISYASSSSAFAGATTITVTYNDGRVLTITLGKPTLNSPGSSKAITYAANDGTIKSSGAVAKKSATGGTWTVTSYSFKGTNGKTVTNSTVVTFTFPDNSCVTGDTLVMLADGTQKRIDQVTYGDMLLVWNFFTGGYDVVPSSIIFYHGDADYDVLNLRFEDGTVVKVINNHGFYDMESNQFVFIDENNVEEYIGHHFAKVDGDSYRYVELVGYEMTEEYTGCYSIQSAMHNNFMVEGMFSLTIPHYEGWFDYFEIGEGMKYDEEQMQADIEKYGLYEYEAFAEYVTYEQFIAFSGPYLKVLVGRGVVTYEQIIDLINTYVNP